MPIQFSTLERIEKAKLIEVFNAAFAGYFVKITLDEKSLTDKMRAENIVLEKSVGAFFEEDLIGFVLLGIENETAYNGGTGVLDGFRGNGLTARMYDFILPKLRAENIRLHQLEVIAENLSAIKSYEKIGFRRARTLTCWKGKVAVSRTNRNIELKLLDEINFQVFSGFWNSKSSWQNSLSAVDRTRELHKIVGAFYQKKLVGYLIHTASGRVKQIAVERDFRRQGIAQTLFAQISDHEIVITNVDENDAETITFLRRRGLDLFLKQFEMNLKI